MLSAALLVLLTQTPDAVTSAEQAAASAERAAAAATKAADALDRLNGVPAVPEAPPVNPDAWHGLIGVGVIAVSGNAQSLNALATGQLDKKWGPWGFAGRALGAYGQAFSNTTGAAEVTAFRAGLNLRGERAVSSFASIFLLGGLDTDHLKSIEARGFGEVGAGITFLDRKEGDLEKLYLRADVGMRVGYETRFQYYGVGSPAPLKPVTTLGPRVGAVLRYAANARFRLSEEAEFLPTVLGPPRYLVNSTTKATARLTDGLSLAGALIVAFDSLPAPGKRETDLMLTLGLEAVF